MSTLGDQRIRIVHASFPEAGQMRADVILEQGPLPSGTLTMDIAGLSAVVTVERAAFDSPEVPHAVVVAGIGWDTIVTADAARSLSMFADPGVRLSSVLRTLASLAGETIVQPTDRTIGLHWGAISTAATGGVRYRDILARMVREGMIATWYVGLDGATRFTPRAASTPTGRATFLRGNGAVGLRVYGVDDPSEFLPGAVVDGTAVGRAVVVETPESLTVECWDVEAPTVRTHLLRIVANAFPSILYGYPRSYIVAATNADKTIDLVPPPTSPELRELQHVPQWSLGGSLVTPLVGALVLVSFRDADDRQPVVLGWAPGVPSEVLHDAADLLELGPSATAIELAGGGPAVVRVGDAIAAGYLIQDAANHVHWRETLLDAWAQLPLGTGPGQAPTPGDVGLPVVGTATTGSSVVESG